MVKDIVVKMLLESPYCVTVDFDTMEDNAVTVRDRDTMEQVRLPIDQLVDYIQDKITF